MAYKEIDGVSYEKELISLAEHYTRGRGNDTISVEDVLNLIKYADNGGRITSKEIATLLYIRESFNFTDAASRFFDETLEWS